MDNVQLFQSLDSGRGAKRRRLATQRLSARHRVDPLDGHHPAALLIQGLGAAFARGDFPHKPTSVAWFRRESPLRILLTGVPLGSNLVDVQGRWVCLRELRSPVDTCIANDMSGQCSPGTSPFGPVTPPGGNWSGNSEVFPKRYGCPCHIAKEPSKFPYHSCATYGWGYVGRKVASLPR